jgi:hypothetical protein
MSNTSSGSETDRSTTSKGNEPTKLVRKSKLIAKSRLTKRVMGQRPKLNRRLKTNSQSSLSDPNDIRDEFYYDSESAQPFLGGAPFTVEMMREYGARPKQKTTSTSVSGVNKAEIIERRNYRKSTTCGDAAALAAEAMNAVIGPSLTLPATRSS